jgi:hypothetical protein
MSYVRSSNLGTLSIGTWDFLNYRVAKIVLPTSFWEWESPLNGFVHAEDVEELHALQVGVRIRLKASFYL